MPVVMFEFEESDFELIKNVLVDAFQDCDIRLGEQEEKGMKLKEDFSPKEFYAFMAIFIQNRTTWREVG